MEYRACRLHVLLLRKDCDNECNDLIGKLFEQVSKASARDMYVFIVKTNIDRLESNAFVSFR